MQNNAEKIFNLSTHEILVLLKDCFLIVGKKFAPTPSEAKIFTDSVIQYQGKMFVSDFKDAFSSFANGELTPEKKLYIDVTPIFIGTLTKTYKESKYGKREKIIHTSNSDESAWQRFFAHFAFYRSLPINPNWIAIFNHLAYKGLINGRPIEGFAALSYKYAEKEVKDYVMTHYGSLITDVNKFTGEPGKGNLGLGAMMKNKLKS